MKRLNLFVCSVLAGAALMLFPPAASAASGFEINLKERTEGDGGAETVTLTVTNGGPEAAAGALILKTVSPSGKLLNAKCVYGSLPAGTAESFAFNVPALAEGCGQVAVLWDGLSDMVPLAPVFVLAEAETPPSATPAPTPMTTPEPPVVIPPMSAVLPKAAPAPVFDLTAYTDGNFKQFTKNNYLMNGGFEDDGYASTTVSSWPVHRIFGLNPDIPFNEYNCCLIKEPDGNFAMKMGNEKQNFAIAEQLIYDLPIGDYTLTFRYRTEGGISSGLPFVNIYGFTNFNHVKVTDRVSPNSLSLASGAPGDEGGYNGKRIARENLAASAAWKTVTVIFGNESHNNLMVMVSGNVRGAGEYIYFDDFSLTYDSENKPGASDENPKVSFSTGSYKPSNSLQIRPRIMNEPFSLPNRSAHTVYWSDIEKENNVYSWDAIDSILAAAETDNEYVNLRILPYDGSADVPAWFKTAYDEMYPFQNGTVNPEKNLYIEHYSRFIKACGTYLDGYPSVEAVDVVFAGPAKDGDVGGEAYGFFFESSVHRLIDAYLENFTETKLLMPIINPDINGYVNGRPNTNVGWRGNNLGDMPLSGMNDDVDAVSCMFDFYPQNIILCGLRDSWVTNPVVFDTDGTLAEWKAKGYTADDVRFIFGQAKKWHASAVNIGSGGIPGEYGEALSAGMKGIGPRLALRKITYGYSQSSTSTASFTTWWENFGNAPLYNENLRVAFAITNPSLRYTGFAVTDVKVNDILPGDTLKNINLPLARFDYTGISLSDDPAFRLMIAIIDVTTGLPAVQLAQEGESRNMPGWYDIGSIRIK